MLGFKRLDHAAVTISGIELVQKIQKHQFKIRITDFGLSDSGPTRPEKTFCSRSR